MNMPALSLSMYDLVNTHILQATKRAAIESIEQASKKKQKRQKQIIKLVLQYQEVEPGCGEDTRRFIDCVQLSALKLKRFSTLKICLLFVMDAVQNRDLNQA